MSINIHIHRQIYKNIIILKRPAAENVLKIPFSNITSLTMKTVTVGVFYINFPQIFINMVQISSK